MNKEEITKLIASGGFRGKPFKGRLVETHISWVVLGPRDVFKIKRPVQFNFLDFSTLDKRKYFCEREVMLNRRLTNIYLDVLPVRSWQGRLEIGEKKGEVIDYAVHMRKLQGAKKMDELLKNGKVRPEQIRQLSEKVAQFHRQAEVVYPPLDLSQMKRTFNDILTVRDWVEKALGKDSARLIEQAVTFSDAFLEKHASFIEERIKNGMYRDVHGDLHSGNIFLYRDPVIFDCIEFNDAFRQIDVLNEVGFFCMDLECLGHRDFSNLFINRYLELFPALVSREGEQLINYYKCYRANVRAKVSALHASQAEGLSLKAKKCAEADQYLKQMSLYTDKNHSGSGL